MQYTLSDIARQFDIPVSTLRYYEKEGGLSFFRRDANGYILIDTADMPSIQLLKIMMQAGLPVKTISRVIGVAESSKKLADSKEVAALYQQVADTMTDHEDELLTGSRNCWIRSRSRGISAGSSCGMYGPVHPCWMTSRAREFCRQAFPTTTWVSASRN